MYQNKKTGRRPHGAGLQKRSNKVARNKRNGIRLVPIRYFPHTGVFPFRVISFDGSKVQLTVMSKDCHAELKTSIADAECSKMFQAATRSQLTEPLGGKIGFLHVNSEKKIKFLPYVEGRTMAIISTEPQETWEDFRDVMGMSELSPVAPFDMNLLPKSLRSWISDVAERMQSPPDFIAVTAIVCLSSLIGRKRSIQPKRNDISWKVTPNLWGMVVGPAGSMKTPSQKEAYRFLERLHCREKEKYIAAVREYDKKITTLKIQEKLAKKKLEKALKESDDAAIEPEIVDVLERPIQKRLFTNDATTEELHVKLAENPDGLLWQRDELAGLFNDLNKKGRESARQFLLEAWQGNARFIVDRVGRGSIDAILCLSLMGSIQPDTLDSHVNPAEPGNLADGFIQRFQLTVWPDISPDFTNIDRLPDWKAEQLAEAVFERAYSLQAEPGTPEAYRFGIDAQSVFDKWRVRLEKRLRTQSMPSVLEEHLAKYRSLIPSLALIFHVCDGNGEEIIQLDELKRALAWEEYLWSHALRIYGYSKNEAVKPAKEIASKIVDGNLPDVFTERDIYRKQWSGLTDTDGIQAGLKLLEDSGWIRAVERHSAGRPTVDYIINPQVFDSKEATNKTDKTDERGTFVSIGSEVGENENKNFDLYSPLELVDKEH